MSAQDADRQLAGMEAAYKQALNMYIRSHGSYWSDKINARGTLTNFEIGISWMATLGATGLERGCVKCQAQTFGALNAYLATENRREWTLTKVVIGFGMEHHTVIAHPVGKPFTGPKAVVFDPWVEQKARTYTYDEWRSKMWTYRLLNNLRAE